MVANRVAIPFSAVPLESSLSMITLAAAKCTGLVYSRAYSVASFSTRASTAGLGLVPFSPREIE